MPERACRLGRLAALARSRVARDDRHLESVRVVILVEDMWHERAEACAEIPQPGHVLLQLRNDDGDVLAHGVLDNREIFVAQWLA